VAIVREGGKREEWKRRRRASMADADAASCVGLVKGLRADHSTESRMEGQTSKSLSSELVIITRFPGLCNVSLDSAVRLPSIIRKSVCSFIHGQMVSYCISLRHTGS